MIGTYFPADALAVAAAVPWSLHLESLNPATGSLVLALPDHVLRVVGDGPELPEPEPGRCTAGAQAAPALGVGVLERRVDP